MELALSLGDTPKPLAFRDKATKMSTTKDLFLFSDKMGSPDPPPTSFHLDLLPLSRPNNPSSSSSSTHHRNRIPWLTDTLGSTEEGEENGTAHSSPNSNSPATSFPMDFCLGGGMARSKRSNEQEGEGEGTSSRGSEDDENGSTRKKLRLSKEQSAFLEETFKEHTTLNPKQKQALAKQLNLRPRQVEVWFQNRRARTKLKQTEVDCEYLKRCCEALAEENKKLQKELQELRALKKSPTNYMQLPATTLTMCPSCERVAANNSFNATTTDITTVPVTLCLGNKPRLNQSVQPQPHDINSS